MTKREQIKLNGTTMDMVMTLSEGNPDAIRIISQLLACEGGFIDVLNLDDMNIRGEQIWVAYKDHCKGDLEELRRLIRARDQGLVDTVNAECPDRRAVAYRASF